MPRFCVNKRGQASGEHDVHSLDAGCSLLPKLKNCIVLGSHSHFEGAMREARKFYSSVDGCPECATECNEHLTTEAVNAAIAATITVSNIGSVANSVFGNISTIRNTVKMPPQQKLWVIGGVGRLPSA